MKLIKKFAVKDHEKMVTASYPELLKRGIAVNAVGTLTVYALGLVLWHLHKKFFPAPPTPINPNLVTIEND